MKRILSSVAFVALALFSLTGCIKNELTTYTSAAKVEWDASAWNANSAGISYPMLVKVPVPGIVTPTTQPNLTRTVGSFTLRVNLVGAQRSTATDFDFIVTAGESTAVAGKHYTAFTGKGTIPANSSYGFVTVDVLNPGATSGSVDLVLQLVDNANVGASVNYAKVGLRIAQN